MYADRSLGRILISAQVDTDLAARLYWLESLLKWVLAQREKYGRLTQLLDTLDQSPEDKIRVSQLLRSILVESSTTTLFSQTGLVEQSGFFSELSERMMSRFLPTPPDSRDLAGFFTRVFTRESDAVWLENMPDDLLTRVVDLFQFQAVERSQTFAEWSKGISEALSVLGSHVASLGLHVDVRRRLQDMGPLNSPFLRINAQLQNLTLGEDTSLDLDTFRAHIRECRSAIREVKGHLEHSGVSVNLVHRLDMLANSLARIEVLLEMRLLPVDPRLCVLFSAELTRASNDAKTVTGFLSSSLNLLARKVVERTGNSGEHYIARTRKEFFKMLASAGGGGLVTVGTTYFKLIIMQFKLAAFFEGLVVWFNYSSSFLFMQVCHFSLATKMSAVTASALAGKLQDLKSPEGVKKFLDEVAYLIRSQFAGVLGNVGIVIAGSVLFIVYGGASALSSKMSEEYALHVIESLHPFHSAALFYAAFTGVLLWISSIVAGWFENWIVYHRLPEALAHHRGLKRIFGPRFCGAFSHWLLKNASGIGNSVSLGFFLAFVPIMAEFFGLPLDVRHVTLSAGSVTMAFSVLPTNWVQILTMVVGILLIGLMNISVSFTLSIITAARARNIHLSGMRRILKIVLTDMLRHPRKYLWP